MLPFAPTRLWLKQGARWQQLYSPLDGRSANVTALALPPLESIEDAYRLAKGYSEIEHINIGGTKPREGADVRLSSTVFATDRDVELLHELSDAGIEVEIRQVPRDEKILI